MSSVNFRRTYPWLGEAYESIKQRASQILGKYLGYRELIAFNDSDRSVSFYSEKLIPTTATNRPRVMLLFSNPHPHSVHQGMFLSPNTKGRANLFWSTMRDAGWLSIAEEDPSPGQLASICLKAEYQGPFELLFYCYYAFPTNYPEDICSIFGEKLFGQYIEPEAKKELMKTIQEESVEAVVTFNKGIFSLVAEDQIERYVDRLMEGELVQSQIRSIDRSVPIFLTFPTGWRYHREYRQFRKASLDSIRTAVCRVSNVPEGKDT